MNPDRYLRSLATHGLNLLIVALVVVAALVVWGVNEWRRSGPLVVPAIVEIPRGAALAVAAERLAGAGAIRSAMLFRLGARYEGYEPRLKYGVYEVPAGASMEEIAELLTEGGASARYRVTFGIRPQAVTVRVQDLLRPEGEREIGGEDPAAVLASVLAGGSSVDLRVTVPEGLTSFQVVEGLRRISELQGEVAGIPPEGSLAPDTYSFARGAQRQALVDQMVAAQRRILAAAWERRRADLPLRTAEEALVLASIVEKETGVAAERPVVASVFVNRLRAGMRLETDPTVIYGITEGKYVLDRGLTQSELERRTPYNTYRIQGLPPTPIANPGRAAIEAVVNPAETAFLFFVADGTGGHAFAVTKREHDENVRRWREIEAARKRAEGERPSQP